jgi:hypothetical protein
VALVLGPVSSAFVLVLGTVTALGDVIGHCAWGCHWADAHLVELVHVEVAEGEAVVCTSFSISTCLVRRGSVDRNVSTSSNASTSSDGVGVHLLHLMSYSAHCRLELLGVGFGVGVEPDAVVSFELLSLSIIGATALTSTELPDMTEGNPQMKEQHFILLIASSLRVQRGR